MAPLSQAERLPNLPSKILLKDQNLMLIFAATLVVTSSITAITPAFANIAQHLGISVGAVSLLVTAYTLPAIVLTPILGVFADRHGRKGVLVASLIVFGLAGGDIFLRPTSPSCSRYVFYKGLAGPHCSPPTSPLSVTSIGAPHAASRWAITRHDAVASLFRQRVVDVCARRATRYRPRALLTQ